MNYKVGEKVIYPNQGVGVIEEICIKKIAGQQEEFYMLRIVSNNSTVLIPTSNVENVGIRRLCGQKEVKSLLKILRAEVSEHNPDWKNRYKGNVERMNSGSIFEVAQVLKNLFFLSFQKSLSFREKKMFDRARQLVVSEIATVQDQKLDQVEKMVDKLLTTTYERVQTQATN
ncbi:MAG: CarD family transcriptional regulator [Acidobacteriota bacterium]|nr:CarD family transcriptional regulator [Acidobacteriota bacterium]